MRNLESYIRMRYISRPRCCALTQGNKGTKDEKDAQIDLVIDRNDHVINLFEIKFYKDEFAISQEYADRLRTKMRVFREATKTKKQLFYMMITTFGLHKNQHSIGLIVNDLTFNDLFEI